MKLNECLAMMILVVPFVGCQAWTPIGPVRVSPLPPDLEYLPPAQVRSSMWVLAAEVNHIEQLLTSPADRDRGTQREAIRGSLERMKIAARTLDQPGRSSQHPVVNQHLGNFVERIERAKRALDRDPPNYYPASTITGSCFLCHGNVSASLGAQPEAAHSQSKAASHVD